MAGGEGLTILLSLRNPCRVTVCMFHHGNSRVLGYQSATDPAEGVRKCGACSGASLSLAGFWVMGACP